MIPGGELSISVVIPAFNAERWIRDAIQSVLGQTEPPLECIVVDDGSTDRTGDEVRRFGGRVRLIRQSNAGVSAARNTGVEVAQADLVAFLDADDVWLPGKLAAQRRLFLTRPELGLVYCAYRLATEDLDPHGHLHYVAPDRALRNTLLLEPPIVWVSSTAVLPRHVLLEVGGFDEHLSTSADTDLAVRVASRLPVDGVGDPLVLYRQHHGQMHHDPEAMRRDMSHVYRWAFDESSPLPRNLRPLESRARANLETTLGLSYLGSGGWPRGVAHLVRAVRHDPSRTMELLTQSAARRWNAGERSRSRHD